MTEGGEDQLTTHHPRTVFPAKYLVNEFLSVIFFSMTVESNLGINL